MPQDVLKLLLLEFGLDLTPGRLNWIIHQATHRRGVHLLDYSIQEAVPIVVRPEIVQYQKRKPAVFTGDYGWDQILAHVCLEARKWSQD